MTVNRSKKIARRKARALEAMARIVRDWDATAHEVAKADASSELRRPDEGHTGLGVYSYRPWINDQDIDLLRWYVEVHKPPAGALFYRLLDTVSERYELDHQEALFFVFEACQSGGLDDDPEFIDQLLETVRATAHKTGRQPAPDAPF